MNETMTSLDTSLDRSRLAPIVSLLLVGVLLAACAVDAPVGRAPAPLEEQPIEEQPPRDGQSPSDGDESRTVEALREVPFRVLLLPERFADGAVITSGPVWYAMAYDEERNVNVSIHATNNVHMELDEVVEIPPQNTRVRGHLARTYVNEGIRSVTWVEDEVAYVVEIECWDVLQDRRCTEPSFAEEVAESLVEVPR